METVRSFKTIVEYVKQHRKKTVVVAAAADHDVLEATVRAREEGLANLIYVGGAEKIRAIAAEHQLNISGIEVVDKSDLIEAGKIAIELVKKEPGTVLMKGKIETSQLLGMVLKDDDLKKRQDNPFLSHIGVFEWDNSLKIFSDAALNIAPDLDQKRKIALNAIAAAHKLGIACPRVAFLSAAEKVSQKMLSSVDADALANMTWDGAIVGGPLAFDGAMFEEAYRVKGVSSPVEGKADILICPAIETGNVLYKMLSWMVKVDMAGIITGAAVPFILTSRADSARVKFLSIATTLFLAE